MVGPAFLALLLIFTNDSVSPGDHTRKISVDGLERSYVVHIPPAYDRKVPTPVVLVLHGALSNAWGTMSFTGLSGKSDQAGFIAVYPNGTGNAIFLMLNAGPMYERLNRQSADDVKFVSRLLDDLARYVNVDARRVYATGMSNGGMMCYRLAAELSERIAAIAPVSGTMAIEDARPTRPVPVMHFHGTADKIVPFAGPSKDAAKRATFKSVEDTISIWCKADGCPTTPTVTDFPDKSKDQTTARRKVYGPGQDGSEVVLIEINGGGHTWPGMAPPIGFLGKSTMDISANDLIWEFFQKHPMKAGTTRPAN